MIPKSLLTPTRYEIDYNYTDSLGELYHYMAERNTGKFVKYKDYKKLLEYVKELENRSIETPPYP